MESYIIENLENYAKIHPYFWNGLFAVLYEEIRDECPVDDLACGYNAMYAVFSSSTTIKSYLSCKKEMSYEDFINYSKGINKQIIIVKLQSYLNKALDYLSEQIQTGKMSRSKNYRQNVLSKPDIYVDDNFLLQQELAEIEVKKRKIIDIFSDLSEKELFLLYRVADGFPFTCKNDDFFIENYSKLNQQGKSLFREALEVELVKRDTITNDKMYDFCQKMSKETITIKQEISPEMLYKKLSDINSDTTEDAEIIKKYRYADRETWETLGQYHNLITVYLEEDSEDKGISLLMFLEWLTNIPSLKSNLE